MSDERLVTLPDGWLAREPGLAEVGQLTRLVARHQQSVLGSGAVDSEAIAGEAVGVASWTRRQVVVLDVTGRIWAWARVHDRAAGRTVVAVTVDPTCSDEDLAPALFAWAEAMALDVAASRGLDHTQLDSGAYATDERQRSWLVGAGYALARTWLQMSRPVTAGEAQPGALPPLRSGLLIRPVSSHDNGLPVAADLRTVHTLLEESFADHFNSYRESFPEFVQRLREDPVTAGTTGGSRPRTSRGRSYPPGRWSVRCCPPTPPATRGAISTTSACTAGPVAVGWPRLCCTP